jgi:ParB-like chromosome segregation protein Spo0J
MARQPKQSKPVQPAIHIEEWPVSRLRPYEKNPRKNDKAVEQMRASIREYGFAVPCLARQDGELIDGHLRLKAAIAEGMTSVPVIPCDGWSDAQVKAFRLMINRSVAWADWDTELPQSIWTVLSPSFLAT